MNEDQCLDKLPCVRCGQDLNHPEGLYKICTHPMFPAPLCILCSDSVETALTVNTDLSSICNCCCERENELSCDLFLCSNDSAECPRQFCFDCLERTLGKKVAEEIQDSDEWYCLVCDPSQLDAQKDTLYHCKMQSIFNDDDLGEIIMTDDNREQQLAVDRLDMVLRAIKEAEEVLSIEQLSLQKRAILEEYATEKKLTGSELASEAEDEFNLHVQLAQRHFDILQRQEADLCEQVTAYGYDVRSLPVYREDIERAVASSSAVAASGGDSAEGLEYLRATLNLDRLQKEREEAVRRQGGSVATREVTAVVYEEEVVEQANEGVLRALQEMAAKDEVLQRFASMKEVHPSRYPPSFALVQPAAVLKALYYGSVRSTDIQDVVAKYNVPRHVVLVMTHARNTLPACTNYWSFAHRVHPSVRKALYYTESVVDQVGLAMHYQLGEDAASVTDFGTADEVCAILQERKRQEKSKVSGNQVSTSDDEDDDGDDSGAFTGSGGRGPDLGNKITAEMLAECEALEDADIQRQQEELLSEARRRDARAATSGHSAGGLAVKRTRKLLQRIARPRRQGDDEDDDAIQQQRERDVHSAGIAMQVKRAPRAKPREPRVKPVAVGVSRTESSAGERPTATANVVRGGEHLHVTGDMDVDGGPDGDDIMTADAHGAECDDADDGETAARSSGRVSSGNDRHLGDIASDDTSDEEGEDYLASHSRGSRQCGGDANIKTKSMASRHAGGKAVVAPTIAAGGSSKWDAIDILSSSDEAEAVGTDRTATPGIRKKPEPPMVVSKPSKATTVAEYKSSDGSGSESTGNNDDDDDDDSRSSGSGSSLSDSDATVDLMETDEDTGCRYFPSPADRKRKPVASRVGGKGRLVRKSSSSLVPRQQQQAKKRDEDSGDDYFVDDEEVAVVAVKPAPITATTTAKKTVSKWLTNSGRDQVKSEPAKPVAATAPKSALPHCITSSTSNTFNIADLARFKPLEKLSESELGDKYYSASYAATLSAAAAAATEMETVDEEAEFEGETLAGAEVDLSVSADGADYFHLNASKFRAPVQVASVFVPHLKEHQREGLQFLWRNTMETSYRLMTPRTKGEAVGAKKGAQDHGCILAHCMGLGKTFTVVAFVVTLLTNPTISRIVDLYQPPPAPVATSSAPTTAVGSGELALVSKGGTSSSTPSLSPADAPKKKRLIHCVLVIVPLVTLENWEMEFKKWTPRDLWPFANVTCLSSDTPVRQRLGRLRRWHQDGGVMILGYDMFRNLTKAQQQPQENDAAAGLKSAFAGRRQKKEALSAEVVEARRYLLEPGPDMVVADEAHRLSNHKSQISIVFSKMRTRRRIALTGSPLQNNLLEYWCMVNWVRQNHLNSQRRFRELFVEPISRGDKADAHPYQVKEMRKKVHVLNKKLGDIVHRRDFAILAASLKRKRQYVLCLELTPFQQYLCKTFLMKLAQQNAGKVALFQTYQCFLRVWNHPCCEVVHMRAKLAAAEAARQKVLAAQNNKTKKGAGRNSKPPVLPPSMASVTVYMKELGDTFCHFRANSAQLLADLDRQTAEIESALLKKPEGAAAAAANAGEGDSDADANSADDDVAEDDNVSFDCGEGALLEEGTETAVSPPNVGGVPSKKRLLSSTSLLNEAQLGGIEEEMRVNVDDDVGGPAGKRFKVIRPAEEATNAAQDGDVGLYWTEESPRSSPTATSAPIASAFESIMSTSRGGPFSPPGISNISGRPPLHAQSSALDDSNSRLTALTPSNRGPSPVVVSSAALQETLPSDWWKYQPAAPPVLDTACMDLTGDDEGERGVKTASPPMTSADLLRLSNKVVAFLSLLALSVARGDKVLVFSQSLYTLDVLEQFLRLKDWTDGLLLPADYVSGGGSVERRAFSNWYKGRQFLRIDGSTKDRQKLIDQFNKSNQYKLFMVCTKAGNMGINLYTANRVVIFDSSWNPVHDLQAISRAYRYGQCKEVFVYRLVAAGSMEEVIYKRQMIKQALSARVVDAQMPDNQREGGDLMQRQQADGAQSDEAEDLLRANGSIVYCRDTRRSEDDSEYSAPIALSTTMAEDSVLVQFVGAHGSERLHYIADQDVLLEDRAESHLNEEERAAAEAEFAQIEEREERLLQMQQQAEASLAAARAAALAGLPNPGSVTAPVNDVAAGSSVTFQSDAARKAVPEYAAQQIRDRLNQPRDEALGDVSSLQQMLQPRTQMPPPVTSTTPQLPIGTAAVAAGSAAIAASVSAGALAEDGSEMPAASAEEEEEEDEVELGAI